ncbi:uncharacterized protein HemY [Roseovarius halotolerans]|uniref:Tetratricopeptide repeat protein n=2 Tax=Roseovarius halotolerans TaxID=505353 RepID=A0A1X6Z1V7_9RHOB|nr:uncharacterized protein HemY [Roseovarius halotolerans]SLN38353.1 tetratricopeptide repeat protein [Roseovarius halotolerans]
MRRRSATLTALVLTSALVLSGCETSEERAQRHFETAMELLSEGDFSRAFVEFRNVFKLDPQHKDARMAYARTQMERGNPSEAYGQFLRVVEQYPDTVEARIALAEMAINGRNWEEARRHGDAAIKLAPDDPRVKVIETALAYGDATRSENADARADAAEDARNRLDEAPDNFIARMVVIDYLANSGKIEEALPVIDEGLDQRPESYELHRIKLSANVQAGDMDAVGETLEKMVEAFPDDEEARRMLITWYIKRGDMEGAERFLRELAQRPDAEDGAKLAVVQFLRRTKGNDAARDELENLIESEEDPTTYIAVLASMDFDDGKRDEAIATLEELLDGIEEATGDSNRAKFVLAQMLAATGNHVGARARVEEILADDPSNVQALKARANWLIEEDKPGAAIIDLRTALSQAPRDPEVMTLMARAHERAGDRSLAGERYALAVELSEGAPEESLRYARFLSAENRNEAASALLTEALNKSPDNLELLQASGTLHIRNQEWNEAQRVIWKLRSFETAEATAAANGLEAEMMLQQDRLDDTVAFLEELSETSGDAKAITALVQTQLRAGNTDAAIETLEEKLAESPDDPALRFLRAGLHVISDERGEAETIYRALLDEYPGNDAAIRSLYTLLRAEDRLDDARAILDEQIERAPEAFNVRMLKAELLEQDRDFEGAIAIYEALYEENSNNMIVANNLASLISTHRNDDESLERAYAVARRLRGIEVPPLQDTYGWIAFRRGDLNEALTHLEPAAEGLPTDPLVQYHLGRTYLELDRPEDARATLQKAIELSGDNPLPQIQEARELLKTIQNGEGSSGSAE